MGGFIDIKINGQSIVLHKPNAQIVLRGFAIDNEIVLGSYTMPMEATVCTENEVIFKHAYWLESNERQLVIENASFYLGGILFKTGYLRLWGVDKGRYRFSFVFKPISNLFFNISMKSFNWNDDHFFSSLGEDVPKTHSNFVDVCNNMIDAAEGGYVLNSNMGVTFYPLSCFGWNEKTKLPNEDSDMLQTVTFEGPIGIPVANDWYEFGGMIKNTFKLKGGSSGSIDKITETNNRNKLIPFIFSAYLLEQFWALNGWTVSGDLFEHDPFMRHTIVNTYALDRYEKCGYTSLEWNGINQDWVTELPYCLKEKYSIGEVIDTDGIWYVPDIVSGTHEKAVFMMEIFLVLPDYTSYIFTATIGLYNYSTGALITQAIGTQDNVNGQTGLRFFIDTRSIGGVDTDNYYTIWVDSISIPLGERTLAGLFIETYFLNYNATSNSYSQFYNNIFSTDFKFKNHLPNITFSEFIKSLIKQFGFSQEYDFENKKVIYNLLSNLNVSKRNILDEIAGKYKSIELNGVKTNTKYTGENLYKYSPISYSTGEDNDDSETFISEILGCPLKTLGYNLGYGMRVPYIETEGYSQLLGRDFDQGLFYLHYKGRQYNVGGSILYPYASAGPLLPDGTSFSEYDMSLKYVIDTYWKNYFKSKATAVFLPIKMDLYYLMNIEINRLFQIHYQKYFAEEIIINANNDGIYDCELKAYLL